MESRLFQIERYYLGSILNVVVGIGTCKINPFLKKGQKNSIESTLFDSLKSPQPDCKRGIQVQPKFIINLLGI